MVENEMMRLFKYVGKDKKPLDKSLKKCRVSDETYDEMVHDPELAELWGLEPAYDTPYNPEDIGKLDRRKPVSHNIYIQKAGHKACEQWEKEAKAEKRARSHEVRENITLIVAILGFIMAAIALIWQGIETGYLKSSGSESSISSAIEESESQP